MSPRPPTAPTRRLRLDLDVTVSGPVATPAAHNALVKAHEELATVDDVVLHGDLANAESVVTLLGQLVAPDPTVSLQSRVAEAAAAAGLGDDLTVAGDADVAVLCAAVAAAVPAIAEEVLDSDGNGSFDQARVVVQTTAGEERAGELRQALDEVFAPDEAAGVSAIPTLLVTVFAYEQRRPLLGVIAMIPVVLVVLWTFGMMAATGIPFGPITALAIGIGLPYSIHVTHRFTEDRRRYTDVGDAIRSTVRHTGGAMAGSAFTTMPSSASS